MIGGMCSLLSYMALVFAIMHLSFKKKRKELCPVHSFFNFLFNLVSIKKKTDGIIDNTSMYMLFLTVEILNGQTL